MKDPKVKEAEKEQPKESGADEVQAAAKRRKIPLCPSNTEQHPNMWQDAAKEGK